MYSHGTLRPKAPLLLTRFSFITTLPQLVCLFKNLINQVAIDLGTWPVTLNSLSKIFGWRSMARFVCTSQVLVSQWLAFTFFLICQLTHKLIISPSIDSQSAWYSCYSLMNEFTLKKKRHFMSLFIKPNYLRSSRKSVCNTTACLSCRQHCVLVHCDSGMSRNQNLHL